MTDRLNPPLLEFGNTEQNDDPMRAFASPTRRCKPFRALDFPEVNIVPVLPENEPGCAYISQILHDLCSGVMGSSFWRARFPGFETVFGTKLSIKDTILYRDIEHGLSIIESLASNTRLKPLLVVFGISQRTPPCGCYQKLKVNAILKDLPSQFITGDEATNYSQHKSEDKGNFIWNIALAVFSKLGGIPWKLLNALDGVSAVFGFNTVASWESGVMTRVGVASIEVVNSWGEPIGRFFTKPISVNRKGDAVDLNPEEVLSLTRQALWSVEDHIVSGGKDDRLIVFHLSDLYSKAVYDAIMTALSERNCRRYKILHINEHSSYRIYDAAQTTDEKHAWPRSGTYKFREPGKLASFYAAGAWNYYRADDYYTVSVSQQKPIDVEFLRGSRGEHLETTDLEHVFQLTRLCYYSADLPSIRIPITIRLGRDAASLALCGLPTTRFHISHLY